MVRMRRFTLEVHEMSKGTNDDATDNDDDVYDDYDDDDNGARDHHHHHRPPHHRHDLTEGRDGGGHEGNTRDARGAREGGAREA